MDSSMYFAPMTKTNSQFFSYYSDVASAMYAIGRILLLMAFTPVILNMNSARERIRKSSLEKSVE